MWGRKRQKKPPEEAEVSADPLLAEIIPFVILEPIVLPERLTKKAKEPEKDEEDAKLDNILQNFLVGQDKAKEKLNEITKTHK